jgi:GR25 family glycosyltransferase involved in LPS biosynthesis
MEINLSVAFEDFLIQKFILNYPEAGCALSHLSIHIMAISVDDSNGENINSL